MEPEYRLPRFGLSVIVQETGIQPDTLRSWERRYQLPDPSRNDGGQRLFSRYDIDVIKWLVARQAEGMRISQAAELWRQLEASGQNPLLRQPFSAHLTDEEIYLDDKRWEDETITLSSGRPLQGLNNLPQEFVQPHYEGCSILNIPSTICDWLGVPRFRSAPLAENYLQHLKRHYQHVILLVIDGLGWHMLQRMLQEGKPSPWNNILRDSILTPITSVVPSTTSAALTTLWTGLTPAETGMVGYELWLKEYGMIANMVAHAPSAFNGGNGTLESAGFDPVTFIPGPVVGTHLTASGIQSYAFINSSISKSGLSAMHMQDSKIMPYYSGSDLWVTLLHLLQSRPRQRTYVNVYWGTLDTLAHRFGPEDERVEFEFAAFSMLLEKFLLRLKNQKHSNTLMLMTADHGLVQTPRNPAFELKNYPDLNNCMVLQPTGENRLSYVHLRNGMETEFLNLVREIWGDALFPARSKDLAEAGLFGAGTHHARLTMRLGDWTLMARGNAYCWWQERENLMLGRHGGLSADEMLVPFAGLFF